MKISILIPARGDVLKIDETIKTAENLSKIIKEKGFDADVLVSDNRKDKNIPLTHSRITKVIIADDLLAYQNFKFLLDNCDSSHAIFLALQDKILPQFLLKALSMFAEDQTITSILGKIYTSRNFEEQILFESTLDKFNSNYFIKYPFGWGIYSLFKTNVMRKAFKTDCDWTDYITTGNLCKTNIRYVNMKMRYYPMNELKYTIKSQKSILNPLPWISYFGSYILRERSFLLLYYFRIPILAILAFNKWYLQGKNKN